MSKSLVTREDYEAQVRSGACYGMGCPQPPAWIVTTMGGRLTFCEAHAEWYRAKGKDIYPIERYPR